jgi:hypothetical protein
VLIFDDENGNKQCLCVVRMLSLSPSGNHAGFARTKIEILVFVIYILGDSDLILLLIHNEQNTEGISLEIVPDCTLIDIVMRMRMRMNHLFPRKHFSLKNS